MFGYPLRMWSPITQNVSYHEFFLMSGWVSRRLDVNLSSLSPSCLDHNWHYQLGNVIVRVFCADFLVIQDSSLETGRGQRRANQRKVNEPWQYGGQPVNWGLLVPSSFLTIQGTNISEAEFHRNVPFPYHHPVWRKTVADIFVWG